MPPRRFYLDRPAHVTFDERKADRAVRFFNECLFHTKGRRFAGKPFHLRDWQEHHIREIFGRVDADGNRLIRQVYWEIPKKNGKSEIAAGVALDLLFADDEPEAEIYGAAADRDQASIVFNVAASMVRKNPRLEKRCKIIDSTKRILLPDYGSYYRALSAEVAGKHGFNSHGVIFDEIHAQKDEDLWEVLTFGAGAARTQPLTFAITTAGVPGESPVAERLHADADQILRGITPCPDYFYPVIYAAEDNADWNSEEVWRACNPALGDFLDIASVRNDEYERARRSAREQNSFRRLRLNQWVRQVTRWLDMDDWDRGSMPFDVHELKHLTWYGGLDLSSKLDLTAFVAAAVDGNGTLWLKPWFWIPRDNMADRPNLEAAKYREWVRQGHMIASEGNEVDYNAVEAKILEVHQALNLKGVNYDVKFATQLAQRLQERGVPMQQFTQGFNTYTEVCGEFESAVKNGRVRHGGHPVLRWNVDCVEVTNRGDGAVRPVKPARQKSGKRIDGVVAALMASAQGFLNRPVPNLYADSATCII